LNQAEYAQYLKNKRKWSDYEICFEMGICLDTLKELLEEQEEK